MLTHARQALPQHQICSPEPGPLKAVSSSSALPGWAVRCSPQVNVIVLNFLTTRSLACPLSTAETQQTELVFVDPEEIYL